jgi:hypothetical protein
MSRSITLNLQPASGGATLETFTHSKESDSEPLFMYANVFASVVLDVGQITLQLTPAEARKWAEQLNAVADQAASQTGKGLKP